MICKYLSQKTEKPL